MRRFLLLLILILSLLPLPAQAASPSSTAHDPLTPAEADWQPAAPLENYVLTTADSTNVRAEPRRGSDILTTLRPGDILATQPMLEQYLGDETAANYLCVLLPEGGTGYALAASTRPITPEEQPRFAVDTSRAPEGFIHAAATGSGHLMLRINNGDKAHQLLLPNDGQWHAMLLTVGEGLYEVSIDEVGPVDFVVRTLYEESLPMMYPPAEQTLALLPGLHCELERSPALVAFAQTLCEGAVDDTERFARIRDYLYKTAKYDKAYARAIQYSKIPDPEAFLTKGGQGICVDYAAFIAIACRAVGIPCQHVYGINPKTGNEHAWNLVWLNDEWQLCDVVADQSAGQQKYRPKAPEAYIRKTGYWDGFH